MNTLKDQMQIIPMGVGVVEHIYKTQKEDQILKKRNQGKFGSPAVDVLKARLLPVRIWNGESKSFVEKFGFLYKVVCVCVEQNGLFHDLIEV